ncbi:MAG: glutaminyl-peptide cyclotransferase [Fuerstiella sp.]|nr:glutaminyl-peptide cyclotransferase [Fuerstiella sp.]
MVTSDRTIENVKQQSWGRIVPACALLMVAAVFSCVVIVSTETSAAGPPIIQVTRVAEYPHDQQAFCQGLAVYNDELLEGTGRYQHSALRRVNIGTGQVRKQVRLADNVFGEGVTLWKDMVIQLTWENGYLIIYDADTLTPQNKVNYRQIDSSLSQGWGVTHDGKNLIVSDGSALLRFIDPETWKTVRRVKVRSGRRFIQNLNELEYVNGEILANVWYSSRIARIDPESGAVKGWLELKQLFPRTVRRNREAVLNGIAWDAINQRLFVTGKYWPSLFEITWDGLPGNTR